MKTVRLPDGGFPFSSLGASLDLSLACIQFGPFYECAMFGEIIVHRMGYFKRTRASDEQLATDPHGQTQTNSHRLILYSFTTDFAVGGIHGYSRIYRCTD